MTADTAAPTSRALPSSVVSPTASFHSSAPIVSTTADTRASARSRPLPQAPPGYDLLDRLGGGGMGEVFLAREQSSDRLVAMKFIRHPGDHKAIDRFLVELRALAKLDHPNIVRVFASDFLRADPFFTMEYLPGGSLSRSLGGDPLPVAEAVALVREVALAVGAAHAENIIHRDLKPSNILVTAHPGSAANPWGTPKVADFGLAKRLDEAEPLSATTGNIGTPGYMPPEQISRKNGEIGPWSDVYGLGATLYHLLTGRAPFDGDTPLDTIAHVLSDPPSRPHTLRSEIPLALEAVVLKCLEKDPKDRYPTTAAFVADLDRFTAGAQTEAPHLTPWRRAKRWVGRNRRALVGTAATVALAVAAVWMGRYLAPVPQGANATPAPVDPREAIEKELDAGKAVALIERATPPRPPRWKEWVYGGSELVPSNGWRDAISFDTNRLSLLTLARDPMTDRYRLEGEFGHDAARPPDSTVGLFLGHDRRIGAGGEVIDRFLSIEYSEFWNAMEEAAAETRKSHQVMVYENLALWRGTGAPTALVRRRVRALHFAPTAQFGTIRGLAVDVSPDKLVFSWRAANEWAEVGSLSLRDLAEVTEIHQKALDRALPGSGVTIAQWEPRRPLGVYAAFAVVSIHTVSLTPRKP